MEINKVNEFISNDMEYSSDKEVLTFLNNSQISLNLLKVELFDNKDSIEFIEDYFSQLNNNERKDMIKSLSKLEKCKNTLMTYLERTCRFDNWVEPSAQIEMERECRQFSDKENFLKKRNEATEIVEINPKEINWILGNWKFLSKYIHVDISDLKKKKAFKENYIKMMFNEEIPMIYVKRGTSKITSYDFAGGGHRMLLCYKLNIPVRALVIE